MHIDDFAMLVVSCDAYTEIGAIFFDLQKKYMGWFDGPRYFINESKPITFEGVIHICVGTDCNWSVKLQRALSRIPERYILFMLEDYFIGNPVDKELVQQALQIMKDYQLRYYKITAIPNVRRNSNIAKYLAPIPSNLRYGINLQAAIFDKEFLMDIVSGPDRSAWKTETDLLYNVTNRYEYDISGCVLDKRNIIDVHNGVIKGMWYPETVEYFRKKGYQIELGNRPIQPKSQVYKMKIMRSASHVLPVIVVRKMKRLLKKMNANFLSDM